jgi:Pyridoxamine 5'-phosphate oxidase
MGIALNDEIRRLLDGRHFGVLATINPDGGPQTSTMWVARDGDDVLFLHGGRTAQAPQPPA